MVPTDDRQPADPAAIAAGSARSADRQREPQMKADLPAATQPTRSIAVTLRAELVDLDPESSARGILLRYCLCVTGFAHLMKQCMPTCEECAAFFVMHRNCVQYGGCHFSIRELPTDDGEVAES